MSASFLVHPVRSVKTGHPPDKETMIIEDEKEKSQQ
jgi:hypothetical protein